ncbi:hypothetical protein RRG08_017733 [Elysia crispata]|uniref:Uncharacterized protein n=1 Tax=Elysia crispata TaxID=231223 RepID=A0AAE0XRV2_9GAST|nr:hypothetical protein RRG08_017733 [Elysia crispata]
MTWVPLAPSDGKKRRQSKHEEKTELTPLGLNLPTKTNELLWQTIEEKAHKNPACSLTNFADQEVFQSHLTRIAV